MSRHRKHRGLLGTRWARTCARNSRPEGVSQISALERSEYRDLFLGERSLRILPGQYFDQETGKHYNYFRDFDPSLGGYIESDPIGLRGGINTYTYGLASPLVLIDPFGLQSIFPANPALNTVVCDGKGHLSTQLSNRLTPILEKCISNCLLVHEFSHVDDFFANGSGTTICKNQPKGVRPGIANADASENKAYGIELRCLRDTLGSLPSCHECRPVIERRIDDIKRMRGM